MLRILVADEHDVVRQGLRLHLETQPNWTVVGEADNGNEAILNAINTNPDVVVLGYKLRLMSGIEVTRQIRARLPRTEVLIYTAFNIESVLGHLVEAGAKGCVLKSEPMVGLIEGIRSVASGKPYFAGIPAPIAPSKNPNGSGTKLTNREKTVVQLIAEGQTNKRVARTLGIGVKTVETHRSSVMRKLDLDTAAQLVRYAIRNGLAMA
jgi:DNA-binding NarL/FixJ family response regulator